MDSTIIARDALLTEPEYVAAVLEFLACQQALRGVDRTEADEFGRFLILNWCARSLRAIDAAARHGH